MPDKHNLSGKWDGTFLYPDDPRSGPTTPFLATIHDVHGSLSGTIIEPNEFRAGTAHASLTGMRSGRSVDFTKSYHGAGPEYAIPVYYIGALNENGTVISGQWTLVDWCGTFEMVRDTCVGVLEEKEVAVEV